MDIGICIDILLSNPLTPSFDLHLCSCVSLSFSLTAVCGIAILILSCNLLITIITHDTVTIITHTDIHKDAHTNIRTLLLRCNCLQPVDRCHLNLIAFVCDHTLAVFILFIIALSESVFVWVCVWCPHRWMWITHQSQTPPRQAFNLKTAKKKKLFQQHRCWHSGGISHVIYWYLGLNNVISGK